MGNTLCQSITDEFQHYLNKKNKSNLVFEDLFDFVEKMKEKYSTSEISVDIYHIGTLFVLDRQHKGYITKDDLTEFLTLCQQKQESQGNNFTLEFRAYCTLVLWNSAYEKGDEIFQKWVLNVVRRNEMMIQKQNPIKGKASELFEGGDVFFLTLSTVKMLYMLLNVESTSGLDLTSFFDLMQRTAESQNLIDLTEMYDEVIPLSAAQQFAQTFLHGFMKIMKEVGFNAKVNL